MNVSSSTYPAVVCLSPSIGSSQADPKLSLKGHGPYAAEANCDVDHYLTNCVHRGCTDALYRSTPERGPEFSLVSPPRSTRQRQCVLLRQSVCAGLPPSGGHRRIEWA